MKPRERLQVLLQRAEEESGDFELDQIAWCVARVCLFHPLAKGDLLEGRPRLAALVEEILAEELEKQKITSWDHLLAEVGERRIRLNKHMVYLELAGWMNREDLLGYVADTLLRVFVPR